jgi:hypothetical protein
VTTEAATRSRSRRTLYATTQSSRRKVDRNHGALIDVAMTGKPLHEPVIEGAVRIKEEEPALAISPVSDVLADEMLEELRLARAGGARHVEMLASLFFCEDEGLAATYTRGDEQVVTASHKPRTPRGALP